MFRINAAFFDVIERYQFYLGSEPNKQKTDYYDLEVTSIDSIRQLLNKHEECFFECGTIDSQSFFYALPCITGNYTKIQSKQNKILSFDNSYHYYKIT